jgi:hypothetical protein
MKAVINERLESPDWKSQSNRDCIHRHRLKIWSDNPPEVVNFSDTLFTGKALNALL